MIQNSSLSSTPLVDANTAQPVTAIFETQVAQNPDRIAVKSGNSQLTYAELNRRANRLAHEILDRRGQGPEPIVLLMNKDTSVISAILAVLKAAKFYVVLEPRHPLARLSAIVEDTQTKLIVTDAANLPLAEKLSGGIHAIINLDEMPSGSDANLHLPVSEEDLFGIFYTSGSTGTPKGVMDNHRRLLRNLRGRPGRSPTLRGGRTGHVSSFGSGTGRQGLYRSLTVGDCLYVYDLERNGLGKLADWLMEEEITSCTLVASVFRHFAMTLESRRDLSFPKMRQLSLGGEPVLRRDVELYKKYFPDTCVLGISFATTEAGGITSWEITKDTEIKSNVVPVGYPRTDPKIFLVDESGKPAGVDQVGEIIVQSHYLSPGYWRQPELTAAAFQLAPDGSGERIYHTGDLGRIRSNGILEHVGRKDQQIKIHGNRIETAEVEMCLLDVEGIKEACADAREDQDGTKELVAYLVTHQRSNPTITEIREALAHRLPDYSIPSRYIYLDALPLLPNGKVNRPALPAPERTSNLLGGSYRAPRDRYELEMVRIWEELLGVQPIGTRDNFFDLGGHSLLAARLLAEIEKRYGQKFPPRILLQASTVEQLAQLLYEEGWKPSWAPSVPIHAEGTRPPLFYIPPFNAVFGFYQLDAFMDRDQPVYGLLASPGGDEFPFTRIEDEAAYHLSLIKTIQPHGPYYLAGWSSGGLVALETAQRLVGAGETVAFLGLFDTVIRSRDLQSQMEYFACRLKYFWRLGPRQLLSRAIARVQKHAAGHFDPAREERRAEFIGSVAQRPDYSAIADRVGYRGYVPQKYPGCVTLFLTKTPPLNPCVETVKDWSRLAAGVQVHAIPGVHNAIFEEPHARPVIEQLQVALHQAQSVSGAELPIETFS